MSHIRQVCAPPTAAPATLLNSSGTQSPAIGSIYKILNTSGLEGKNILQLIPVPTSSIKSNAVKATVASPHHLSFQTHLSNCTAMPMIHVPFLQQVNTGQNIVTSKPDPSGLAHRVAAEVYAASLRDKSVSIDKPLLPKSAMVTPNQANKPGTVVKTNRYPVTVKSPVLPSGHHLQIPAHAEVKSVPASSLPLSIQQKILTAAAASASGTQGSNMPSVIFVSPVNTVKTDCSKRLPPLYPKPHVSNSAPVTFAKSQESRNASSCSKVAEETPMKWIVHDSPQSESQCLVPVKSSNNMASKILKTLADNKTTDNSTANIISLCSNSTSDTKTKISPIKDNALVMYNGKVYLLAKKGMNAMIGESENATSPSVKMVDKPSCDITNPGTLNTLSNQVVDMVLSKNKNISLSDGGKSCINPGIVLQTKAQETNISHPVTLHVNQENQPRIVSTIRINTNGKCTIKSDYSANHENANVAIQEEDTVKTYSVQTDTNDLLKSEQEVAVSPEPPCNLTSNNLGKRIGLLKEIKVNLERIPSDVIECCSRKTEQRLTSGVATGKEDTGTAFERKVHEIRKEISIAFEPESCKPPISELCNNPGSKQMNKSEEPAQKEVKNTLMVQPVVHQNASTEVSVEKDVKAASINQLVTETFRSNDSNKKTKTEDNVENGNLTKEECSPVKDKEIDCAQNLLLIQTPLLNPNIFEQISSDLKLTIMKENKSQLIDNLQKMSEECTLASSVEHASTSLPNANIILSLNSNVLKQQAEMDAKKRKANVLQQQAEMGAKKRKPMDKTGTKRTKHIKGNMLNNIVPANDRLPAVNQQLQRSQVSQQEAKLKSKVLKKRKIKLDISTKRNKNEACILTSDSEAIISSNLVLSESNSPSSEVCNVATELKSNHANKRKQKLVPMQTPNLMKTEKECLINQDLTADSLFESSSCHSELLQMQPDSTERNQSKELCILTKHPETSNTETDRNEKICASSKDLETAKPDKRRIEEEAPNRERDRKEVCMLNKKQMISTNKKQTDFVCPVSKDPVIASPDTNGNEVICSISKDPETNNSKSNKTEVDYSVSKGSESTNTETRKNIEVCAISKNSETTNTCPTLPNQGASQSSRGHSQLASELKRKHQEEETHTDNIQNTETIQINECSVFKEGTAGSSKAPTWHQPLTSILQVQAVASPILPTTIGTTIPGPSSETLQGTSAFSGNHVRCESFPLPPLEVDETMIEERREERIRRLKDRLKEQERALEAIRKTMRPIQ